MINGGKCAETLGQPFALDHRLRHKKRITKAGTHEKVERVVPNALSWGRVIRLGTSRSTFLLF
jgi:hypothetical protein